MLKINKGIYKYKCVMFTYSWIKFTDVPLFILYVVCIEICGIEVFEPKWWNLCAVYWCISCKRVLCTVFKLYLLICTETSSTEVFHSKESKAPVPYTKLLHKMHNCVAQELDLFGSKTSVLDVSMHINTCNVNRVHNTLLHEAHQYCPFPISWNLWGEEQEKDEGKERHWIRG
jgi:hypothetical protein